MEKTTYQVSSSIINNLARALCAPNADYFIDTRLTENCNYKIKQEPYHDKFIEHGIRITIDTPTEVQKITMPLSAFNSKSACRLLYFILNLVKYDKKTNTIKPKVEFELSMLTKPPFQWYTSAEIARKMLKDDLDTIMSLDIRGRIKKRRKNTAGRKIVGISDSVSYRGWLISYVQFHAGKCRIVFNKSMKHLDFLFQFFYCLPQWFWSLDSISMQIEQKLIMYASANNTQVMKYTNEQLAILTFLPLETNHPQRDTISPIEEAKKEIMQKSKYDTVFIENSETKPFRNWKSSEGQIQMGVNSLDRDKSTTVEIDNSIV